MLAIVGIIMVMGSIIIGFAMEGGAFILLLQVAEFIIIGGSALGALLISAPGGLIKKIIQKTVKAIKPGKLTINKEFYIIILRLLYDLFQLIRINGLLSLEEHIENPKESSIFTKYPLILAQPEIVSFITDTFRLMSLGNVAPHSIESIMEVDAETLQEEGMKPGSLLQKVGDSLPGLGIVAAVLGIIITMKAINGSPEEVGHKVAAALVGTFLGVLLSYGFVQPLATNIEMTNEDESRVYEVMKAGITAFANGMHPLYSLEFARRSIFSQYRPSFSEMEEFLKKPQDENGKAQAGQPDGNGRKDESELPGNTALNAT